MENVNRNQLFDLIAERINARTGRSAWSKGVTAYALEMLEELKDWVVISDLESPKLLESDLLNGARDWNEYSWGGCSLIYNCDIAERLCCPSELKKTNYGDRRPNSSEEWLDTQARALYQACQRIKIATAAALKMIEK